MNKAAFTPEILSLIAERFKALAEPARLQILNALRTAEMTVTALVEETGFGQANVSKHLQLLHSLGFVTRRKDGLFVYYSIGDKRIFQAELFYDVTHSVRRKLHEGYIRQCLDNFTNNVNVIQFTSAEFTGPLHFMQFWLDMVSAWEQQHPVQKPIIALSCTKDVQDAILADATRRATRGATRALRDRTLRGAR